MKETTIITLEKPKLRNPICIVGLPGIGNIGRIAMGYAVQQLKAKKFAELYSPYFFPFVMIHEDKIHTLRNEFYYYKDKKRDYIFVIGDCQSYDPKGHHEVAGSILEFLKSFGCKEVITIGGFGTGKVTEKPQVYGAATDQSIIDDFKKSGVKFDVTGKITTIVGASGLIVGLSNAYGMKGICLLGETSGYPIITDPTAAEAVLTVLQKTLNMKLDLKKLDEKVKAMHEFIKKLDSIQQQATEQISGGGKKKDDLKYIG
ncbi:MAG: proteasome assembly chaperone family protein [Nanoarchaeota archaeon]|nr:proteasome assembly chaperone family protein [Nanoarchaeota archaeon]MBU4124093.1 proteasome assembly chaperone family protein [Nanoarchaeota archaeon]